MERQRFGPGAKVLFFQGTAGRGRRYSEPGFTMMFAVLHIADFPLQAVLRLERELAARPVALFEERRAGGSGDAEAGQAGCGFESGGGTPLPHELLLPLEPREAAEAPPATARVIACTAAARAAGVEIGQTVPQALARCAELLLRGAQRAAEAEARASLLAAALAVSPLVEDTAPGMCTISVAALPEEKREGALRGAVERLAEFGLVATAGLAATPLLAEYAAREGRAESPDSAEQEGMAMRTAGSGDPALQPRRQVRGAREGEGGGVGTALPGVRSQGENGRLGEPSLPALPRLGAESAKVPDVLGGLEGGRAPSSPTGTSGSTCYLRCGEERAFLKNLPLAVAEPTAEIAEILTGWGVRTLGELTALSKAEVTQRLGPAGLALWERAAGEVVRPLRALAPAQNFAAELTLENEVETLEPLLFVLRRFIDRLALELRNAGFVAGEMTLGLKLTDETVYERTFRLPEPTAREEILFRVLHTHLESLQTAATVGGLSLSCRPVRPLARQQGIFESALRDPHGFAETLARVAAVVGADRVGTPVVQDSHRADAVALVKPATVVPPMSERAKAPVHPPRGLPLRRYRPPAAATVELSGGGAAPAFVWAEGVRGEVRACAGPWRSAGEWWDRGQAWRREEWDVELDGGGVYRLLRVPEGWFVEGEYD